MKRSSRRKEAAMAEQVAGRRHEQKASCGGNVDPRYYGADHQGWRIAISAERISPIAWKRAGIRLSASGWKQEHDSSLCGHLSALGLTAELDLHCEEEREPEWIGRANWEVPGNKVVDMFTFIEKRKAQADPALAPSIALSA